MTHPDDLTLQAWHDGELEDDQRAEITAHVETCADCDARAEGLRVLARAVQGWVDVAPALPDDFAELLAAKIERERPVASLPVPVRESPAPSARPAKVVPLRRWFYPALAAAAAGVIALRVAVPTGARGPLAALQTPVLVGGEGSGGAKVTRVDVPGAQSFTVMQLPGVRPDTVTAVVWIQDRDESGGSP